MRQSWPSVLCLIFLVLLGACSTNMPRHVVGVLPASDSKHIAGAYSATPDYRLGAQDLIEVSVFGVDELTKTVRINSNGRISLPLVGSIMAGGATIAELEGELARRYSDGFLQRPQITVFVKEYISERITLEGAVREPGIYPMGGKITLLQAIAVAKGLDPLADLGGIVIFREVDGERMAAAYHMRDLRTGRIPDPQLYAGDVVVVEQSGSKTVLRRFIETVPALGLFLLF